MPSIAFNPPIMELLRSQTTHDDFPASILDGMLSPDGATSEAVTAMDDYIRQIFIFDMPKNFYIQMAIAGAWICVLFIIGNTCVLHRMLKKAFWLFQFQRRTEGTYVVPNALNSFLFFEGFFAILWIAFVVVNYEAFWLQDTTMQYHIGVFNLIVWSPLYMGAFMAGWGSFYTAPGALEKGPLSLGRLGKVASRPLIINICCLGTPILLIASLLAPIVLTQRHYNTAFNAYKDLHTTLTTAMATSPNQTIPMMAAQGYLERASEVWQMQTISIWYASIGYAVWSVWAGVLLLFYIPAGGYLCYLLWKQLQEQKATMKKLDVQKGELERMERERQGGTPAVLLFQPVQQQKEGSQDEMEMSSNSKVHFLPQSHNTTPGSLFKDLPGEVEKEGDEDDDKDSEEDSGPVFFFPPLAPAIERRTTKQVCLTTSPQSRYNYLRRCFINLFVLYIGIVLGATLYLGVAASLAASYYESYLTSPQDCMHLLYNCMVVTAWGSVVFGTLTIFAILARFADPANPSSSQDEAQTQSFKSKVSSSLPRFLQRSTSDKTLVNSIAKSHEDDKSTSVSTKVQRLDHQQSKSMDAVTSIDSAKSSNGIFFRLRKHSGKIIMHPADVSLHAMGESTSVDLTEQLRSDVSRRIPSFVPQDMTQGSVVEDLMEANPSTASTNPSASITGQQASQFPGWTAHSVDQQQSPQRSTEILNISNRRASLSYHPPYVAPATTPSAHRMSPGTFF